MDWVDVILHILGAAVIAVALRYIGTDVFSTTVWNWLFWFVREAWQRWKKNEDNWWKPHTWSMQKTVEWIAPTVTGLVVAWNVDFAT